MPITYYNHEEALAMKKWYEDRGFQADLVDRGGGTWRLNIVDMSPDQPSGGSVSEAIKPEEPKRNRWNFQMYKKGEQPRIAELPTKNADIARQPDLNRLKSPELRGLDIRGRRRTQEGGV